MSYFKNIVEKVWWYRQKCVVLQPKILILSQNKQKVASKNERNDNDDSRMPSGSMTKVILSL